MLTNDKVAQNDIGIMNITQALMDDLTAQAKASPRLRMNYDLRNSAADGSQRMLNAIEPGSPAADSSASPFVGDGGVPAGAFA